jgi:hypothetical protein
MYHYLLCGTDLSLFHIFEGANRMHFAKQILAIFISLLLCIPSVVAQNPQSTQAVSKDVTIIIERQQVRFTTQKAVEEMRLQVFDQAGELVYDSGVIIQPEINWPLQNGNGERSLRLHAFNKG